MRSKNLRLSSSHMKCDKIQLLPDRVPSSNATIKEINQYLMKDSEREGIRCFQIQKMCDTNSQLKPPSPMKCLPRQTATCDDVPNITDIRVSHDDHIESNSLTEESQEQHTTPAQYKAPVTTDDKNTITEETVFNKLDQTLLIDSSAYFYLPIDSSVSNLKLEPGVSFLAYCNNMDYHDTTIPVIVPKGYYLDSRGQFHLNEEICELNCNICKREIIDSSPQGIGFRNCTVQVKYRDTDRKSNCFSFVVNGDNFAFAKLSQPGHIRYHYVRFQVNAL